MKAILGANNAITRNKIINKWGWGVKVWLGYQKEPFPFVYSEAPHLKQVAVIFGFQNIFTNKELLEQHNKLKQNWKNQCPSETYRML